MRFSILSSAQLSNLLLDLLSYKLFRFLMIMNVQGYYISMPRPNKSAGINKSLGSIAYIFLIIYGMVFVLFYELISLCMFLRIYSPVNYSCRFTVVSFTTYTTIPRSISPSPPPILFQTLETALKTFSRVEINRFYRYKSRRYSKSQFGLWIALINTSNSAIITDDCNIT